MVLDNSDLFRGVNKYRMNEFLKLLSKNYANQERKFSRSHEIRQKLHAVKTLSTTEKKAELLVAIKELEDRLSKEFSFESHDPTNNDLMNHIMDEVHQIRKHVSSQIAKDKSELKTTEPVKPTGIVKPTVKKKSTVKKIVSKKKISKTISKRPIKKTETIHDDKLAEILTKINKLKEEDLLN